jgi:hypothetical protein
MRRMRTLAILAVVLLSASAFAEHPLVGNWTIDKAEPAPWRVAADGPPDRAEIARLVHKKVTFSAKQITGPTPLACAHPHFVMKDYAADMLFQGQLGETEQRGGAKAEASATALGYTTRPVKTLETGCEGAIDFHLRDADHVAFGLNNMIYWLSRSSAR